MTIQKFLQEKLDEGYTLNRLANLLEVNASSLSRHLNKQSKRVRLSLAKKINLEFGIYLDGFHKKEINPFIVFDEGSENV